jgi:hypothetical protein
MARQRLNRKSVNRLRRKLSLDIVGVYVRGNTDHRKDLCMAGGAIYYFYKDGLIEKSSSRHDLKWGRDPTEKEIADMEEQIEHLKKENI